LIQEENGMKRTTTTLERVLLSIFIPILSVLLLTACGGAKESPITVPEDAQDWPATLIPAEYRQVQASDVETLLVSGSVDGTTPARYATEELLPSLGNGEQVILSEFGHVDDVWDLQPEATMHLLTTFYDTGVADDSLYTHHPVDFKVGLGYPALAKLGLAAIVGVIVLLGILGWFIARKLRRRRAKQMEP
jgi:hypothetical protein